MLKCMQWWWLKRRVHSSWLIAFASLAILIGVTIAPKLNLVWLAAPFWAVTGFALLLTALWRQRLYVIALAVIGGLLIGLWRGVAADAGLAVHERLHGDSVLISGDVMEDVDIGKSGELVLRLNDLQVSGHDVAGKIWVTMKSDADIWRGDHVTIQGKLVAGFGVFSSAIYRAKLEKIERPQPGDVALQVRDWFAGSVRLAIPDPQAALGIGYLLGQRRALPPDLDQALQIAGLTHIVVASGYNLTILVRLSRRLFMRVSKYAATLAASGMVFSFVAITGASPSMTRAGLVAGLSLAAWYYGRKFHPLVLLPFAAAVTVLINPSYAWGDLGWQLSFLAFIGVMILAPLGQAFFFGDAKPGVVRQVMGETISAQIMTLPVLVLAFGQYSNVALAANLLVLPLVPLAMLLTFIAGIGALVFVPIASLVGLPATWLLGYMVAVTHWLAGLSWAQGEVEINVWIMIGSYLLIAAACVYMWWLTRFDLAQTSLVE